MTTKPSPDYRPPPDLPLFAYQRAVDTAILEATTATAKFVKGSETSEAAAKKCAGCKGELEKGVSSAYCSAWCAESVRVCRAIDAKEKAA
jgi:hypothetical protein